MFTTILNLVIKRFPRYEFFEFFSSIFGLVTRRKVMHMSPPCIGTGGSIKCSYIFNFLIIISLAIIQQHLRNYSDIFIQCQRIDSRNSRQNKSKVEWALQQQNEPPSRPCLKFASREPVFKVHWICFNSPFYIGLGFFVPICSTISLACVMILAPV